MKGKKICDQKDEKGNCPHHNIHCSYPRCEEQEVDFKLGDYVITDYYENEKFKVVGIRETELELLGDWSGGTHNVMQKSWYSSTKCVKVDQKGKTEENIKAVNELFEKIAKDNPHLNRTFIGGRLSQIQKELTSLLEKMDSVQYVVSGPI